jgi:GntR family transcriptional regulator
MKLQQHDSLAKRLARILRKQLRTELSLGGRLPAEQKLAEEFDVSRATVRQALTMLEREGMIIRRHGSGTYANKYALQTQARAEIAYEFTEMLDRAGYQPSIEPIIIEKQSLTKEIATKLEREEGEEALWIEKLFLADNHPAVLCRDVVPGDIIRKEFLEAELTKPIFDFLEQYCGMQVSQIMAEIIPDLVDEYLSRSLNMEHGEPLLRFEEVGFNTKNQPVLYSRIHYNDQFVRFSVLRAKV